jgi:spermidine synthase
MRLARGKQNTRALWVFVFWTALVGLVAVGVWAGARALGRVQALLRGPEAFEAADPDAALRPFRGVVFTPVETRASAHQTIRVVQTNKPYLGKCMVLDQELQLCDKDEHRYHELLVHFPVQYLPNSAPEQVLIVGGGDCMALREVLKYPSVREVVVLELDREVCAMAEKHFGAACLLPPEGGGGASPDPRVTYHWGDAATTLESRLGLDAGYAAHFDLILVDTTEDTANNLSIDRPAFFRALRRRLDPRGVLVKNGEDFEPVVAQVFPHTLVYGFLSKSFETVYRFVIGAGFDPAARAVVPSQWRQYGVAVRYYDVLKQNGYVSWYARVREAGAGAGEV